MVTYILIYTDGFNISTSQFDTFEEAMEQIERFIIFYNSRRPHYSIGLQTPNDAHEQTGEQKKIPDVRRRVSASVFLLQDVQNLRNLFQGADMKFRL